MTLLRGMTLLAVLAGASMYAQRGGIAATGRGSGESCYAAKDLVVQALELLRADSSADDAETANQLLKRATELCAESGEAWYFRSLVEARLNHPPRAEYAMRQAKLFPSDALRSGVNPFVLSTPRGKQPQQANPIRNKWALVIGVGSFQGDIPSLPYAVSDATEFRDALIGRRYGNFPAENVKLLVNENATLRNIKEALNWLARSAEPDDLVVVYIASHGSARAADTREANYILTSDTEADTQDHLYATALPMVDLSYAVATRLRSLRTAVFIDTCFSEAATSGREQAGATQLRGSVSQNALAQITQGTGRIIFGASKRDQQSWESQTLKHGYFTYYLVQAIETHPEMPLTKVFASVQKNVSAAVETDHQHLDEQTPVLSRSADDVDFALGDARVVAISREAGRGPSDRVSKAP